MGELIERDKLITDVLKRCCKNCEHQHHISEMCESCQVHDCIDEINGADTINAVEVVRCEKCEHGIPYYAILKDESVITLYKCAKHNLYNDYDWFCADGTPKQT